MRIFLLGLSLLACGPDPADIAANLQSDNPVIREDTAKIAHNFDSPEVRSGLIAILEDDAEDVRLNAIKSLIELGATDAVPTLLTMLETETHPRVHREVIDALARLGEREAVPVLIAYIEDHMLPSPPLNAIWALGHLQDNASMELLSELTEHSDTYVAWNARQALSNLRP